MSPTDQRINLTKGVSLPDPLKLARYKKAPECGPKVLFFSGGTALRQLSQELVAYTHNSVHLITTFDSGGSSAALRRAFAMPAIGDIRNRLMALADQSLHGAPETYALFAHRLPKDESPEDLVQILERMVWGRHPLIAAVPDPMRKIICNYLGRFIAAMPKGFDLRGASIGNLILTAGYIDNRRQLDPVIYIFAHLVHSRGVVRPILNKDLHLAAKLSDGRTIVGQHLLTGKEAPPLETRIDEVWLCSGPKDCQPVKTSIRNKVTKQIQQAELICYPIGSFYSSLLANLLPGGVGQAVAEAECPKVFVPNTAWDPELFGQDLVSQTRAILDTLKKDSSGPVPNPKLLNFVLVDREPGRYPGGVPRRALEGLGVEVVACKLSTQDSRPFLDANLLNQALLSLT